MIFQTPNQKAIKRLSRRSLKANQLRNCFAIIAIALTTILFTSIFTIGIGMIHSFEESNFRMAGGYAHGGFKYLEEKDYLKLREHPAIKESGISILVGLAENPELIKHHTEIRYVDEYVAKWMYMQVTEGRMPIEEDEVALDTAVLNQLGLPHELGVKVPITYTLNGEQVTKTLTVTGLWEKEQGVSVSQVAVSMNFIEGNLKNLSEEDSLRGVGKIFMDVMLKSPRNIEATIYQIAKDSGYEADGEGEDGIDVGINWGYTSARGMNLDPINFLAVIGACLLVGFTGYLMIYNIFHISVMRDIRYYGLLKTIGTTPKQLIYFIRKQALYLSAIGIPLGLIGGYLIGSSLLGIIMKVTNYPVAYTSANPVIFIGSACFALITIWISTHKPGRIAARISPVEAAKYTEVTGGQKTKRKTKKANVWAMAYGNFTRQKRKTALIITSMSLSVILLNSVYTYTQGFDMNKYLERFVVADFIIGHANYFNVGQHFRMEDDQVDEAFINQVTMQEGFIGGGMKHYNIYGTKDEQDRLIQLYGLDDYLIENLEIVEGEFDLEKFKEGGYILESVSVDDYGELLEDEAIYEVGEKVTLRTLKENAPSRTYEVMAKVKQNPNDTVRYSIGGASSLCLTTKDFIEMVGTPMSMAYFMEVEDELEPKMEDYLKESTKQTPMNYESKQRYMEDFKGTQNMFLAVGFVASSVIGLIGIFNFINATITNILTRQGEFTILQSIGMTKKQLRKMLILEGLLYSSMTVLFSLLIGSLTSFFVVKPIGENLWFFTYSFKLAPVLIIAPMLIVLGVAIPALAYYVMGKETIVERLKKLS